MSYPGDSGVPCERGHRLFFLRPSDYDSESMLDGNDTNTFYSIRLLYDSILLRRKPVLFWVGAGASAWCGFPLWKELADSMHSQFSRYELTYAKRVALQYLHSKEFPEFFKLCRETNEQRYQTVLASNLKPRPVTAVYHRFLESIGSIMPLFIVTTNGDESLENNLSGITVVQRSDLERCVDLFQQKQSFVCKLHGSVSAIGSLVFTADDYAGLIRDARYLGLVNHIFAEAIVVFVGYGLGDQYVVDLLARSADLKKLFGDGPHFAILSEARENIPESVKQIRYIPTPHKDHRSAIQIVDEARKVLGTTDVFPPRPIDVKPENLVSGHLLSDVFPPGTWSTSQTAQLTGSDGISEFIQGNGVTSDELPVTESTAMHDLLVGLVCFDKVFAPITSLRRIHSLLGGELFEELIRSDSFIFLDWGWQLGIHYKSIGAPTGGDLIHASIAVDRAIAIRRMITTSLRAIPGREEEAEALFNLIQAKTQIIDQSVEPDIPGIVRGLLLRPSIRKVLGMSGGIIPTSIPRWMTYPVLRLGNLVKVGIACQLLGLASTKLEFGAAKLAGPAFAAATPREWADSMAGYVLTGRFDTDVGKVVVEDPTILRTVIKFRDTQAAVNLRREILQQLSVSAGSDIITSVNAGLRSIIPLSVLESARDQLSGLLIRRTPIHRITPALWNNVSFDERALSLWRRRSRQELKLCCDKNRITKYDLCPCESGEKFNQCCGECLPVI